MPPTPTYERPQIVEIGRAVQLTLGDPNLPYKDNCGCKQAKFADDAF